MKNVALHSQPSIILEPSVWNPEYNMLSKRQNRKFESTKRVKL